MTTKAPGYRRQKRKGKHDLAFVELNGKRHYLGPYDDPASRSEYHRLVGEWEATGRRPDVSPDEITVVELVAAYVRHATAYYVGQDGKPTSELGNVRRAVKPLRELYGRELANTFGPRHLKAVRQSFIDAGMCRRDCNRYAKMIRRVFKWGVSEGLVDANVHVALGTLDPLKRGRSEAWETEKIKPVADAVVEAVEPYVSRQVWALVRLQLLTAARPGELVGMRSCDIDRSGDVWVFAVQQHKTAYRDAERVVYLGPQAQQIISDFTFDRAIDEPLFSPQDAERERAEKRRANRTAHPSVNKRRDAERAEKGRAAGAGPRQSYTVDVYRRAINRACVEAGVDPWTPHRLRHSAATRIRRDFGYDAAQVILGHQDVNTTQVYAEVDRDKAVSVIGRVG